VGVKGPEVAPSTNLVATQPRARDRLLLADVDVAAASTFDFGAGRGPCVRFAFGFTPASTGLGAAVVGAGLISVMDFRPSPRAVAMADRCSE
jgi:hypothetical protein